MHDEVVHTFARLTLAGETISLDDARVAAGPRLAGESVGQPSAQARPGSAGLPRITQRPLPRFARGDFSWPTRAAASPACVLPLVPRHAKHSAMRRFTQGGGCDRRPIGAQSRRADRVRDQGRGFVPAITEGAACPHSVVGRLGMSAGTRRDHLGTGAGTRPSGSPGAPFPATARACSAVARSERDVPLTGDDRRHAPGSGPVASGVRRAGCRAPGIVAFTSVLVVLAGLTLARGAGTRLVTGAESAAVIAVAWTATAVNALALPTTGARPISLDPWVAASLASMLSIFRPYIEAVVCGVGVSVIGMVLCWQAIPDSAAWPALPRTGDDPLITVVLAIVVRRTGDGMAWDILRTQRESAGSPSTPRHG